MSFDYNLPSDEPTSITFEQSVVNIIDKLLAQKKVSEIGIKNRAVLTYCVTAQIFENWQKLPERLKAPAKLPDDQPEKTGFYFKPNMDSELKRMAESQAMYNLAVLSRQAMFLPPLRTLLGECDPDYEVVRSVFKVTLDDLRKQYQQLMKYRKSIDGSNRRKA